MATTRVTQAGPGGCDLTFVSRTGGWIAERDGFTGAGAVQRIAVERLERAIALAELDEETAEQAERAEAEREWSHDLAVMQGAYAPTFVEVQSWDH